MAWGCSILHLDELLEVEAEEENLLEDFSGFICGPCMNCLKEEIAAVRSIVRRLEYRVKRCGGICWNREEITTIRKLATAASSSFGRVLKLISFCAINCWYKSSVYCFSCSNCSRFQAVQAKRRKSISYSTLQKL